MFKLYVWNLSFLVLFVINRAKELDLSPDASWNQTGTTIAGNSNGSPGVSLPLLSGPVGISISNDDVLYIADSGNNRIVLVYLDSNTNFTRVSVSSSAPNPLNGPRDCFTTNTSLYVSDTSNRRVQQFLLNGSNPSIVSYVNSPYQTWYLHVVNDANVYLSMSWSHIVLLFQPNATSFTIVAGTGVSGPSYSQLNLPYGIFVNQAGTVYIADRGNHRIMKWYAQATSGIVVAGSGVAGNSSTQLNSPTDITVDTNGYMYISEGGNNRITRWGPNATFGTCIVACTGVSGAAAAQLNSPHSLAFDSNGSLYVCEWGNDRVQKFEILSGEPATSEQMLTSTFDKLQTSTNVILSTAVSSVVTITTTSHQNIQRPSVFFVPPSCSNQVSVGFYCNVSRTSCDLLLPCRNYGTCINNNNSSNGYICSCLPSFSGIHCEIDSRMCKPDTCWNSGTCYSTTRAAFICLCTLGWEGVRCEWKVDYCRNITCQNHGVCRSSFLNYSCECLNGGYSGRYCEIIASQLLVHKIISQSFAYISIIAIMTVVMFVVIMDILSYCFGIDPVEKERKRIRRGKRVTKRKPVIQRFVYVNASRLPPSNTDIAVEATTISKTIAS